MSEHYYNSEFLIIETMIVNVRCIETLIAQANQEVPDFLAEDSSGAGDYEQGAFGGEDYRKVRSYIPSVSFGFPTMADFIILNPFHWSKANNAPPLPHVFPFCRHFNVELL